MNFDLTLEFQKLFADANAFDKFDDIFLPGWHGYRYFSLDNPPPEKKVQSIGKKRMTLIGKSGEREIIKAQPHLYRSRGYGVFTGGDQTVLMVCLENNIFRRAVAFEHSAKAIQWGIRENVYYKPRLLPVDINLEQELPREADVEQWVNEKISYARNNNNEGQRFLIISGLHLYSDIKGIGDSLKALPANALQRMHEKRLSSSTFIFSREFGYGVAGVLYPRFVVKHKQNVWLFRIPSRLRNAMVEWAKAKKIYDEARAVEQMLMQISA